MFGAISGAIFAIFCWWYCGNDLFVRSINNMLLIYICAAGALLGFLINILFEED